MLGIRVGRGIRARMLISISDGLGEKLHEVLAIAVAEVADLGAAGEAVSEDL